jgi:GntR family transcriptional repressor for pyruvate dehydrogenase complex
MAVTDEAILRIKEMILTGELSPGERLPPEKELSDRLGLSRNSMREAIKALELIRVLDVRRGDGTYVTSLEPRLLLEALSFIVDLQADGSILELFAVRRILEPAAVALAARSIDAAAIEELRRQIDSVDEESTVEGLMLHDVKFHNALAAASGNSYLSTLIESLSGPTVRARMWHGLTQEDAVARTLAEHRAILNAVVHGDAKLAEALATVHISGVEQSLRTWSAAGNLGVAPTTKIAQTSDV